MENFKLKNIQLGEVKLRVKNLSQSVDFYQKTLGLKILEKNQESVKLTADGIKSLIELVEIPNVVVPDPESRIGIYHFAILLPTRKDFGLFMKHLITLDIQFGQADHLVSEAIYLTDPNNIGIEVYHDTPRESWKYENNEVVMATNPLAIKEILDEVEEDSFIGLPVGTVMGHIHLHVGNLERDGHFFTEIIGFEVALSGMSRYGALFLSADSYHHHLGLNIWAGASAPVATALETGLEYFTILLPSDQLDQALEHLNMNHAKVSKVEESWFVQTDLGIQIKLDKLE